MTVDNNVKSEDKVQQHLLQWLSSSWGHHVSTLPFDTRLKEDLELDDIAREELFHFLDEKSDNNISSSEEIVFSSQTVKDILDFYSGNIAKPKIAILFPGQGAQVVGMGKELLKHPKAKDLFDKAQQILGYDLLDICLNGPQERLDKTEVSQVAIFVCTLATLEVVKASTPELLQRSLYIAGLSLGEYTALVAAGALDFEAGLTLVKARAEAMQAAAESKKGGMVSVLGADEKIVNQLISDINSTTNGSLTIANYLCPGNIVVSGDVGLCDEVVQKATKAPRKLAVAGAFHSSFMLEARNNLEKALSKTKFSVPNKTVMCNLTGGEYNYNSEAGIHAEITHNLLQQLTSPVRWQQSITKLVESGVTHFYEIGPGTVLTGLMRHILKGLQSNQQFNQQSSSGPINDIRVEKIDP